MNYMEYHTYIYIYIVEYIPILSTDTEYIPHMYTLWNTIHVLYIHKI